MTSCVENTQADALGLHGHARPDQESNSRVGGMGLLGLADLPRQ